MFLYLTRCLPEDLSGKEYIDGVANRSWQFPYSVVSTWDGSVVCGGIVTGTDITAPEVDAEACGDYAMSTCLNSETFVSDWKANWKLLQQWEGNILGAGGCASITDCSPFTVGPL